MLTPFIPISWGELFDKITILQIKLENLQDQNALKNVKIEYRLLLAQVLILHLRQLSYPDMLTTLELTDC